MGKDSVVVYRKNETDDFDMFEMLFFRILKNKYLIKSSLTLRRHCNFGPRPLRADCIIKNQFSYFSAKRYVKSDG